MNIIIIVCLLSIDVPAIVNLQIQVTVVVVVVGLILTKIYYFYVLENKYVSIYVRTRMYVCLW